MYEKINSKSVAEHKHNFDGNIAKYARYLCELFDYNYTDSARSIVSRILRVHNKYNSHTGLIEACEENGIPVEDVSMYWHKGKNYSIKVNTKKDEVDLDSIQESVINKMASHTPSYHSFTRDEITDPHLLVLDPADIHFGKLSSFSETKDPYNIKIATKRVVEGCNAIVDKASKHNLKKIMFLVGNDVLHVDNSQKTTTSGTRQDTDVMFNDMFQAALDTYVKVIDSLVVDYDVDIVFNSSNHDYLSGWMLAKTLESWYRLSPNVTIDAGISHRKYYQYGNNLIGSSHGDGAKLDQIPLLMANEAPSMWCDTKYRYVYLHHIHHKQQYKFMSGKDYIGVTVEYLRSPSGIDSWHHRNGYCGSKKAIEGFLHSYSDGQVARFTHYF